jgi:RES domain
MVNIPEPNDLEVADEILYHTIKANERLLRIYREVDRIEYGLERFRAVRMENCRFDHHDPSNPTDKARRVIYTAETLSCALVECFGDTRTINTEGRGVAVMTVNRDLKLLDLRGVGAMRVGCVFAISGIVDRKQTQKWSRHFYERLDLFGKIDGLIHTGAYNGENVIVLNERCEDTLSITPTKLAEWRTEIIQTAKDNNMKFEG